MESQGGKQVFRCPCYEKHSDYQKIVDLRDAGLIIYRQITHTEDVRPRINAMQSAKSTSEDIFILQNTKDVEILSEDILPTFDRNKISCPRCIHIVENAKKLLGSIAKINKNDIMGICDHCRRKLSHRPCQECDDVVKKFVTSRDYTKDSKRHIRTWLSKIHHLLKDVVISEKRVMKKSRTYSDFKIQILHHNSPISLREPDVGDLFYSETLKTVSTRTLNLSDRSYQSHPNYPKVKKHTTFSEFCEQEYFVPNKNKLFVSKSDQDLAYTLADDSLSMLEVVRENFRARKSITELSIKKRSLVTSGKYKSEEIFRSMSDLSLSKPFKKTPPEKYKSEGTLKPLTDLSSNKLRAISSGKYKSDNDLPSLSDFATYDYVKEGFGYMFLKNEEENKRPPTKRVSSSELIKNTQDMLQAQAEEKMRQEEERRKLQEEKERIRKAQEEEKRIQAKIERQLRLEQKRLAEEEAKRIKAEEKNRLAKEEKLRLAEEKGKKLAEEEEKKRAKEEQKKFSANDKVKKQPKEKPDSVHKKKVTETVSKAKASPLEKKNIEIKKKEEENPKPPKAVEKIPKVIEKPPKVIDKSLKTIEKPLKVIEKPPKTIENPPQSVEKPPKVIENPPKAIEMPSSAIEKPSKVTEKPTKVIERPSKAIDKPSEVIQKPSEVTQKPSEVIQKSKKEEPEPEFKEKEAKKIKAEKEKKEVPEKPKGDKTTKEKEVVKEESKKPKTDAAQIAEFSKLLAEQAKAKEEMQKLKKQAEEEARKAREAAEKVAKEIAQAKIESITIKKPQLKPEPESKPVKEPEKPTTKDLNIKQIKVRKPSPDDLILQLVQLKQATVSRAEARNRIKNELDITSILFRHKDHTKKDSDCIVCDDSNIELELESINNEREDGDKIADIIIGQTICKYKPPLTEKNEEEQVIPVLFKSSYKEETTVIEKTEATVVKDELDEIEPSNERKLPNKGNRGAEQEDSKGIIRYALSDRTFIDKGWTMLPTEKVVRKMNVYRMRPAKPEFDWFEHNKNKRLMQYDTGEKLAEFDDNGRGRWYYKNGRLALDYYDAEETNAQQRYVIYSSGEPDERGRSRPITILGTFDYLGNGVVFDHCGKIRLKYNQTEGVVLDRTIGPVSHWKWHTLNDPPVLQQVMIDTQMSYKDPEIVKLGGPGDIKTRPDNEEMLAIEFDNFIKEKSKKLTQKFKPFQIKMKALKINESFSLKVLDQATVYLIFRDGSANLKLNIGMILDHKEIVDTDTAEVGEVSNSLERLPARTDSIAGMQASVAHAARVARLRGERARRLRPPEPCASADRLAAAAARPLRPAFRTAPSSTTPTTSGYPCICRKPPSSNLYYDTRLI